MRSGWTGLRLPGPGRYRRAVEVWPIPLVQPHASSVTREQSSRYVHALHRGPARLRSARLAGGRARRDRAGADQAHQRNTHRQGTRPADRPAASHRGDPAAPAQAEAHGPPDRRDRRPADLFSAVTGDLGALRGGPAHLELLRLRATGPTRRTRRAASAAAIRPAPASSDQPAPTRIPKNDSSIDRVRRARGTRCGTDPEPCTK